jgi:hypothetical protein
LPSILAFLIGGILNLGVYYLQKNMLRFVISERTNQYAEKLWTNSRPTI